MDLNNYDELLEKAYEKIPENVKQSSRFETPKVELRIESRNTFIINFNKIISTLNRDKKHFVGIFLKKAGTMGEIRGQQLFLKGIYKDVLELGAKKGIKPTGFLGKVIDELGKYTTDLTKIGSSDFLKQYKHIGERAMRFMGKEFAKGIRRPNIISRSFSTFKDKIKDSPVGSFASAVGARLDEGKLGDLRRMFGFKNAYQKVIKNFTWEIIAEKQYQVYGKLIKEINL